MAARQGDRLKLQIEQLLLAARLERSGHEPAERPVVDAAALARDAVAAARAAYPARQLVLDAREVLPVRAVPEAILQVLGNLLDNAAKHAPDKAPDPGGGPPGRGPGRGVGRGHRPRGPAGRARAHLRALHPARLGGHPAGRRGRPRPLRRPPAGQRPGRGAAGHRPGRRPARAPASSFACPWRSWPSGVPVENSLRNSLRDSHGPRATLPYDRILLFPGEMAGCSKEDLMRQQRRRPLRLAVHLPRLRPRHRRLWRWRRGRWGQRELQHRHPGRRHPELRRRPGADRVQQQHLQGQRHLGAQCRHQHVPAGVPPASRLFRAAQQGPDGLRHPDQRGPADDRLQDQAGGGLVGRHPGERRRLRVPVAEPQRVGQGQRRGRDHRLRPDRARHRLRQRQDRDGRVLRALHATGSRCSTACCRPGTWPRCPAAGTPGWTRARRRSRSTAPTPSPPGSRARASPCTQRQVLRAQGAPRLDRVPVPARVDHPAGGPAEQRGRPDLPPAPARPRAAGQGPARRDQRAQHRAVVRASRLQLQERAPGRRGRPQGHRHRPQHLRDRGPDRQAVHRRGPAAGQPHLAPRPAVLPGPLRPVRQGRHGRGDQAAGGRRLRQGRRRHLRQGRQAAEPAHLHHRRQPAPRDPGAAHPGPAQADRGRHQDRQRRQPQVLRRVAAPGQLRHRQLRLGRQPLRHLLQPGHLPHRRRRQLRLLREQARSTTCSARRSGRSTRPSRPSSATRSTSSSPPTWPPSRCTPSRPTWRCATASPTSATTPPRKGPFWNSGLWAQKAA